MIKFRIALITIGVTFISHYAYANSTASLNVKANVLGICNFITDDLSFGTYDPFSNANLDNNTNITVNCTKKTCYNINLDLGNNASGQNRNMHNLASSILLRYNLYKNSALTSLWNQSAAYSGIASGKNDSITVYGRIPPNQNVTSGLYSDTVTATLSYNISDCSDGGGEGGDGEGEGGRGGD